MTTATASKPKAETLRGRVQKAAQRAEIDNAMAQRREALDEAERMLERLRGEHDAARQKRLDMEAAGAHRDDLNEIREHIRTTAERLEDWGKIVAGRQADVASAEDDLAKAPDVDTAAVVAELRDRRIGCAKRIDAAALELKEAAGQYRALGNEALPLAGLGVGVPGHNRLNGGSHLTGYLAAPLWWTDPKILRVHPAWRGFDLAEFEARLWPNGKRGE